MRSRLALVGVLLGSAMAMPAWAALPYDLSCMQNATDRQESGLIAAFDTYNSTVRAAMETRRSALRSALSIKTKQAAAPQPATPTKPTEMPSVQRRNPAKLPRKI